MPDGRSHRKRQPLTAAFVRTVKGGAKPRRYADAACVGLYLLVQAGERPRKSWVLRAVVRGVRTDLGLGPTDLVSLSEARDLAIDKRRLIRNGGDPRADKRRDASPSFRRAAEEVIALKRPGWRGAQTEHSWRAALETYAMRSLGERPVSEITTADALSVIKSKAMNFMTRLGMAVCVMFMLAPSAQSDEGENAVLKEIGNAAQLLDDACGLASTPNEHALCAAVFRLLAAQAAGNALAQPDIYARSVVLYSRMHAKHLALGSEAKE